MPGAGSGLQLNLLGASRESRNISSYRDYIEIIFPSSLLTISKFRLEGSMEAYSLRTRIQQFRV